MSDHPKYIVISHEGFDEAIVFSPALTHKEVAGNRNVVSAGFCSFGTNAGMVVISCWGESVSLNIKSRPVDSLVLEKNLFLTVQY